MRRILLVVLALSVIGAGPAIGGSALYVHDTGPDWTSGIVQAACLDAGYDYATYGEQSTLPNDLTGYDLIILNAGFAQNWAGPIGIFLNDGGNVLTLGATCFYLGTPLWTGADYWNAGGQARVVFDAPLFGLHEGDIVNSSNNASDSYRCSAAAWGNLRQGAVELVRWEPNPNGADCGQSTYAFGYPYGNGLHVQWGDATQYSAIRGIIQFLAP